MPYLHALKLISVPVYAPRPINIVAQQLASIEPKACISRHVTIEIMETPEVRNTNSKKWPRYSLSKSKLWDAVAQQLYLVALGTLSYLKALVLGYMLQGRSLTNSQNCPQETTLKIEKQLFGSRCCWATRHSIFFSSCRSMLRTSRSKRNKGRHQYSKSYVCLKSIPM